MFNFDFSVHALLENPHRLPLYDWQTEERFHRKMTKLKLLWQQRCPCG